MNIEETGLSDTQSDGGLCVACREPIHAGATLCPCCRSRQIQPTLWERLSIYFKWLGGITAVLSLIALAIQLNEVYRDARERRQLATNLIRSAQQLGQNSDYASALELMDQAIQMTNSLKAQKLQAQFAMKSIQCFNKPLNADEWQKQIKPLISIMIRGIGSSNPQLMADILAHIAYAHSLADLRKPAIPELFQQALSVDPQNLFGHAMWGVWYVRASEQRSINKNEYLEYMNKAMAHFQLSIRQERKTNFLCDAAFTSLFPRYVHDDWHRGGEILLYAHSLRQNGYDCAFNYPKVLLRSMRHMLDFGACEASLLSEFSPEMLLNFLLEIGTIDDEYKTFYNILIARLLILTGKVKEGVNRLRALRLIVIDKKYRHQTWCPRRGYIDNAIIKGLGIKWGRLGIQVEELTQKDGASSSPRPNPGVRIKGVHPNAAADIAGLKVGDIILAVNAQPVDKIYTMHRHLKSISSGEKVPFTIVREGKTVTIPITIKEGGVDICTASELDQHRIVHSLFYNTKEVYLSYLPSPFLVLADLTLELQNAFAIRSDIKGTVILEEHCIIPGEIRYGDVVTKIGNTQINSAEEAVLKIDDAFQNGKDKIIVEIVRDNQLFKNTISLPQ